MSDKYPQDVPYLAKAGEVETDSERLHALTRVLEVVKDVYVHDIVQKDRIVENCIINIDRIVGRM